MALLIDRATLGRDDGIIAPDLSDKMNAMKAEQIYGEHDLSFDLEQIRLWIEEYSALAARGAEIEGVATSDGTLPGSGPRIFARFYNPEARGATLLFVHGGGWVMGGVRSHDHIARWLAAEIGARVIQIDYSLAPEHPYPAALNEIIAALSSVLAEAAGAPVFVAGDSAGANLAACAILRLSKDERSQIAGFVSIYGAYAPEMNLSSHRLYGDGRFGLSEPQMRWFWNLYAPQLPPEARARELSPLTADLSDFPPTLCIGAECDLLLDDTLAFYGELTKVGVDVSLSLWSEPAAWLPAFRRGGPERDGGGRVDRPVRARSHDRPSLPSRCARIARRPRAPAAEIARPRTDRRRAGRRLGAVAAARNARPSHRRRHHPRRAAAGRASPAGGKRRRSVRRLAQRLSRSLAHPCGQGPRDVSAQGRLAGSRRAQAGTSSTRAFSSGGSRSRRRSLSFATCSSFARSWSRAPPRWRRCAGRTRTSRGWRTRFRAWRAPIHAPAHG